MSKLYFKYGAMGSSKTANALMCRFNYIEKGFNVIMLKPSIDDRYENNKDEIISRIGLRCPCLKFKQNDNLIDIVEKETKTEINNVVIVDECQFLLPVQVEQLKTVSKNIPVLCYGLLTNFKTELFAGSKRLVELAESIQEIKSVCKCGKKATVNARIVNGRIVDSGEEILIGDEEYYEGMCYWCYKERLDKNN